MRTFRVGAIAFGLSLLALALQAAAQGGNGSLKVTSYPSGAKVAIDGADTGKATPMSVSLSVGEHTVVVSIPNSGWGADQRTVTVIEGNNDLSVTLLPLLTVGPVGPAGPKGEKGDKGDPGPPGAPGEVTQTQFDALVARVAALQQVINAVPPPSPLPPPESGNDFSCSGVPAPTTAADPIAITGIARRITGLLQDTVPAPGVVALFHRRSDDAVLASGWTDENGAFSLTVPTGGLPLDGYLSLSGSVYLPTRVYAPFHRVVGRSIAIGTVLLVTSETAQALYQLSGVPFAANQSTLIAMTSDCSVAAVANATVTAVPAGGPAIYLSSRGLPTPGLPATTTYGMAWLLNQPPGDAVIQARLNGTLYAQGLATTTAGGLTYVYLIPGT